VDRNRLRALHVRMARSDQALLGGGRMNTLRVAWLFFKVGVMNELQYRVNFFVQLLQSLIQVGTGLVMLSLVYSHTTELNGWHESELLALLGVQILLGGFIHTFIQPNMELLMQDVQQGTLDYALTKPEDAQILVSVRQVRIWQIVEVISGLVLLIVGLTGVESSIGVVDTLTFAFALGIGGVLVYCFWLILTIGAFWVVRIEHVLELFEGIYQTGRWPVGVYPGWLRYSVTFLVPVAFAVTVPAEALTSRLHWPTLALSVGFALVLFAFTRWFWRLGLRNYSGASA
jgi:ABC-2 type transport system permease protein